MLKYQLNLISVFRSPVVHHFLSKLSELRQLSLCLGLVLNLGFDGSLGLNLRIDLKFGHVHFLVQSFLGRIQVLNGRLNVVIQWVVQWGVEWELFHLLLSVGV